MDELPPFEQSVQLAEELDRRGHPHEFYSYEGLSHYFSTSTDNATRNRCGKIPWIACTDGWKVSDKPANRALFSISENTFPLSPPLLCLSNRTFVLTN